jgi:hypothetical protein
MLKKLLLMAFGIPLLVFIACKTETDSKKNALLFGLIPASSDPVENVLIYKGVLTGGDPVTYPDGVTGYLKLTINQDDPQDVSLALTFDKQSQEINTAELLDTGNTKTYNFNESEYAFSISTDQNGSVIGSAFSYSGIESKVNVAKEDSNTSVEIYASSKGTFGACSEDCVDEECNETIEVCDDKGISGTWNFMTTLDKTSGTSTYEGAYYLWGNYSGTLKGTIDSGDNLNGTWEFDKDQHLRVDGLMSGVIDPVTGSFTGEWHTRIIGYRGYFEGGRINN